MAYQDPSSYSDVYYGPVSHGNPEWTVDNSFSAPSISSDFVSTTSHPEQLQHEFPPQYSEAPGLWPLATLQDSYPQSMASNSSQSLDTYAMNGRYWDVDGGQQTCDYTGMVPFSQTKPSRQHGLQVNPHPPAQHRPSSHYQCADFGSSQEHPRDQRDKATPRPASPSTRTSAPLSARASPDDQEFLREWEPERSSPGTSEHWYTVHPQPDDHFPITSDDENDNSQCHTREAAALKAQENKRPDPRDDSSAAHMRLVRHLMNDTLNPYKMKHGEVTPTWRALLHQVHGPKPEDPHDFLSINSVPGLRRKVETIFKWHRGQYDMDSADGQAVEKWLSDSDQLACRGLLEHLIADIDRYKNKTDEERAAALRKDIENKEAGNEIVNQAMGTSSRPYKRAMLSEDTTSAPGPSSPNSEGEGHESDNPRKSKRRRIDDESDGQTEEKRSRPRQSKRGKRKASTRRDEEEEPFARIIQHIESAEEARERHTDRIVDGMERLAEANLASSNRLMDVLSKLK